MIKNLKNRKTLKNIITSVLLQIVTIICGFIAPRLIIKTFGSNVNGVISSITQFLGYITLLESGIAPVIKAALYKPIASANTEKIEGILKAAEKFFRTIALIFVVYLTVLCIAFPVFYSDSYSYMFTLGLVLIISISTFFEYFFGITYSIYIQALQNSYIISIIKIFSKIANTLLIVTLIKFNCSIHIVKLTSSFVFVLTPLFLNYYVKHKYNINLKRVKDDYKLENKWDGLSQHIAAIVHGSVDIAVLTFFTNPIEVSVYSVYMLVINSVKNLSVSLSSGVDALFGSLLAKNDFNNLRIKYRTYEIFYFTVISLLFSCTSVLIMPFIMIYTNDITDANYYRPFFAYLMLAAQLVTLIRVPSNSLVLAAGHFKQVKKAAWIEAIMNVVISVVLVFKYGIVGVAIGTLVSMIYRSIHFIVYASKEILNISLKETFTKILIMFLEIVIVQVVFNLFSYNINTYFSWFIYAVITLLFSILVVALISFLFYKKDLKNIKDLRSVKNE